MQRQEITRGASDYVQEPGYGLEQRILTWSQYEIFEKGHTKLAAHIELRESLSPSSPYILVVDSDEVIYRAPCQDLPEALERMADMVRNLRKPQKNPTKKLAEGGVEGAAD